MTTRRRPVKYFNRRLLGVLLPPPFPHRNQGLWPQKRRARESCDIILFLATTGPVSLMTETASPGHFLAYAKLRYDLREERRVGSEACYLFLLFFFSFSTGVYILSFLCLSVCLSVCPPACLSLILLQPRDVITTRRTIRCSTACSKRDP